MKGKHVTNWSVLPEVCRRALFCLLILSCALILVGASADDAQAEPSLKIDTWTPDHITSGKSMKFGISVLNDGDRPWVGELTLKYTLPEELFKFYSEPYGAPDLACTAAGESEECTADVDGLPPGRKVTWIGYYYVSPVATGVLTGNVEVSGGGTGVDLVSPLSFDTSPVGPFRVKNFSIDLVEGKTVPVTQAGSHPEEINSTGELVAESKEILNAPFAAGAIEIAAPEHIRDVIAHVQAGVVGNPGATSLRCTAAQLGTEPVSPEEREGRQIPSCPDESQVGVALIDGNSPSIVPVYNIVPQQGDPAEFGFYYEGVTTTIEAHLRPNDYGIDLISRNISTTIPVPKFTVTFWGTPAATENDHLRAHCTTGRYGANGELCPLSSPEIPFLRLPTSCSGNPLSWGIEVDTYEHVGMFHQRETSTPPLQGCNRVPFDVKAAVTPTERVAHSPSGVDVGLSIPQDSGPNGISEADLRTAELNLPKGVTINPASADGLAACSDVQLRLGLEDPSDCPGASKLGTIQLRTPLLEEPVEGSVYLRSQASKDPASGEMYRLAIELRDDERGIDVKLPGSLRVDPQTGQLTTTFDELPQLPFETMQLHLKAGPRAPLTMPQTCGKYASQMTLIGWNGKTVEEELGFTVDQNCSAPGFAPGFEAGVSNPTAGSFSPFSLRVTRDSGQPNLSRIDATLPEGELAKLAGVPVCSGAQAAGGDCPAGSRIGKVVGAVGEGSSPLYLPQPGKAPTAVYFAGPYKGAPYSILTKVPAQAGPFDLGTVLVRSALRIDPQTTQVSVESDPLPQIFGGIPVSYRDVRVEIDRPEYTLNPTDCEPTKVTGRLASATGQSVDVADRFQVGDCAALGFKPALSISLKGRTTRAGHPALTAVLQMPKGGANIARTSVSLPHSEFLAQAHIVTTCTRVQYAAGGGGGAGCPKGSVYGRARAFSPLLDYPLEGPVYLRSNGGERELPDLVASLGGQIHVDLVGYVDSDKKTGGIRTTFAKVPDAPVSKFVLKMPAGRKSLLENSTNICRGKHRAIVKMDGQNGKVHDFMPLVRARCGKRAR